MKLLNINIGIKIDNTPEIAEFIKQTNADIVAVQEIVRHLEPSVYDQYKTKEGIEKIVNNVYPYKFFGPLWVTEAFRKNGKIHRDFNGIIEQGNEILSKFPITEATNEHYYKSYSYALDWTNWEAEDHGRAVQIVEITVNNKPLQILNLHGIWTKDKLGDQRTDAECEYIISAAQRKKIPTIITGDFNLLPHSNSIKIINSEYNNLIKKFNITSTRPEFKDNIDIGNNVVDYIFISKDIIVNSFEVIQTNISDHLPLLLDFEIEQ